MMNAFSDAFEAMGTDEVEAEDVVHIRTVMRRIRQTGRDQGFQVDQVTFVKEDDDV